jgi:hypothetical protein
MKKVIRLFALIILYVFVACENLETEKTTVNLAFKTFSASFSLSQARKGISDEGFMIDTAVIVLEKIKLTGEGTGLNEILFTGPYEIDLLSKKSVPDLPVAGIAPGIYNTLAAELYVPMDRPYSIYITGTYTLNEKWWRFLYTLNKTGDFVVKNPQSFEINENTANTIWILIDVVALFMDIDFSKAMVGTDQIIRINNESNSDLAEIIENNFEGASMIDDNEYPVVDDGGRDKDDDDDEGNDDDDDDGDHNDDYDEGNDNDDDEAGSGDDDRDEDEGDDDDDEGDDDDDDEGDDD